MKKINIVSSIFFLWIIYFLVFITLILMKTSDSSFNFVFYFVSFHLAVLYLEFRVVKKEYAVVAIGLSFLGGVLLSFVFNPLSSHPLIMDYVVSFSLCWSILFLVRKSN